MLNSRLELSSVSPKFGFSAITMIVIMLVLGVLGAVTSSIVISSFESSQMYLTSQQAFYSAEAGMEWVNKAITFVANSDNTKANGRRVFFSVKNNTGANITISGLVASWTWSSAPADSTIFFEQVRIDGGAYNKTVLWDYSTNNGGTRGGIGELITLGTSATLVSGTQYEFQLYDYKQDQTGTSSNGSADDSTQRVAFVFTPNSLTVGQGTFTITAPAVGSTDKAVFVSTATVGSAERKLQLASTVVYGPLAAGVTLTVATTPGPSTSGPSGEDMTVGVENETGADISVTSITCSWSGARYYDQAKLGNTTIFSGDTPRKGDGDTVTFSSITISDGTKKTLALSNFKNVATGGNTSNRTSLSGIATQIEFSDGSVLTFTPS